MRITTHQTMQAAQKAIIEVIRDKITNACQNKQSNQIIFLLETPHSESESDANFTRDWYLQVLKMDGWIVRKCHPHRDCPDTQSWHWHRITFSIDPKSVDTLPPCINEEN